MNMSKARTALNPETEARTPERLRVGELCAGWITLKSEGYRTVALVEASAVADGEAHAAFIVKACNAHDDLVEALRTMVEIWEGPREYAAVKFAAAVVNARATLAKVQP